MQPPDVVWTGSANGWGALLLASSTLALACSGKASRDASEGGPAPLGPVAGAGGSTGAHAGAPNGGNPGTRPNPFPCEAATPVVDETSGYLRCANGLIIRAFVAECPSLLPRSEAVADFDPARDQCEFDSDCTEKAHGFCADAAYTIPSNICNYGCTSDADCDADRICACGDPVGICIAATCRADSDCEAGFHCSRATSLDCAGDRFMCQTPEDGCATSLDCPASSGGYRSCGVSSGEDTRVCAGACALAN